MELEEYSVLDFPPVRGSLLTTDRFVYIFCWVADDGVEVPFYVGQTDRLSGRMNDYCLANFTACTDFCVGEAVKYLKGAKNYRVVVRHKPSPDPKRDEKTLIRCLMVSGVWLLNCLPRYDYRTDNAAEERETIHRFCDMFTAKRAVITSAVDHQPRTHTRVRERGVGA